MSRASLFTLAVLLATGARGESSAPAIDPVFGFAVRGGRLAMRPTIGAQVSFTLAVPLGRLRYLAGVAVFGAERLDTDWPTEVLVPRWLVLPGLEAGLEYAFSEHLSFGVRAQAGVGAVETLVATGRLTSPTWVRVAIAAFAFSFELTPVIVRFRQFALSPYVAVTFLDTVTDSYRGLPELADSRSVPMSGGVRLELPLEPGAAPLPSLLDRSFNTVPATFGLRVALRL